MPRDELVTLALELLQPLGAARARRMFGGHGLYVDDLFIALIAYDRIYLKADAQTRAAFEAAGCQPFVYTKSGGQSTTMGYWSAPAEAMESPAQMQPWARLAMAAALRARASKAPAAPRARRATPPSAKTAASRGKASTRRT